MIVPLALTHRLLGQLVGARRPTVSTALGELAERGELVRRVNSSTMVLLTSFSVSCSKAQTRAALSASAFC